MKKTEQSLDDLKAKYGDIKIVAIDGLTGYFRKPDIKIWRFATKALEKSMTQFKVSLAKNCFVQGDEALLASPYIEDIADEIDAFASYEEAEVTKEGNAYRVSILDKSCRLRPVTIELQTEAERNNPEKVAFKDQQNMLTLMWIDGDEEIRSDKNLDYHMPVLQVVKKLREKHLVSIKNA